MQVLSKIDQLLVGKGTTVLLFGAIALITYHVLQKIRLNRRLPPGPYGLPFVGCTRFLTPDDNRRRFAELRRLYGDVFCFSLGCRRVIVVNGIRAMKELFVTRGNYVMDRPQVFTFTHYGQGKGLVNNSGESWKEHRKFTQNTLRDLGIGKSSFADKIQEEVQAFVSILDKTEGEDFDPTFTLRTAIANIVCSISFGKRFDYDDPVFVGFLHIFQENMMNSGGMALLNYFPFLHHMPGDRFKSHLVLKNVAYIQGILRQWLDTSKERFNPDSVNDFIDAYLKEMQDRKDTTFSYDQLLKLVGDLLVGGTETTGTTLRWMFIYLVRWPHVQQRMREEIDTVYPDKEPSSLQDRRQTPYVEAAIFETQRFADIAPFSVTHTANEDVEVEGQLIPKGSIIIPNINSVHCDPGLWGDPNNFRPERFLDEQGEMVKPDYLIPFFIGKRSCPGERLASSELYLFITTILQRYEIRPASEGKPPTLDGHVGFTHTPLPFKVRFISRDQPPPPTEQIEGDLQE